MTNPGSLLNVIRKLQPLHQNWTFFNMFIIVFQGFFSGVYLHDYPDLVTPAPFLGQTRLKILACKVSH